MSRMAQNHFLKLSVQLNKVLRPITIASDWYLTRKQLKFCSFQTMNEKNYTHTITPTFTSQRSLRIEKRKYIFRFKAIIWLNIIVPPKLKKGQETSASDALFFFNFSPVTLMEELCSYALNSSPGQHADEYFRRSENVISIARKLTYYAKDSRRDGTVDMIGNSDNRLLLVAFTTIVYGLSVLRTTGAT